MALLRFPPDNLKAILEHAKTAPQVRPTFAQMANPAYRLDGRTPGEDETLFYDDIDASRLPRQIFLVGDSGIYLMSAGEPGLRDPDRDDGWALISFARECNPQEMSFDDWWSAKRDIFGGDDGVEAILVSDIEAVWDGVSDLIIDVSPECIVLTKSPGNWVAAAAPGI